jgi:hypothetical protein
LRRYGRRFSRNIETTAISAVAAVFVARTRREDEIESSSR